MKLRGQATKERSLLAQDGCHGANLRATERQEEIGGLKVDIPGILEGGQHRRIGLDRLGQFIEDKDAPVVTDEGGDSIPAIRPARKGGTSRRWRTTPQRRSDPAPLEHGRFLLRHPVAPGDIALAGPLAQQRGFPNPPPTIEHEEFAATPSFQQTLKFSNDGQKTCGLPLKIHCYRIIL